LAEAELLIAGADEEAILREIGKTNLDNLIEFVRAVHAEMAALTDAARRGIAVQDCTMFVTTFPCHHCARHIVAAGIKRVVYVAPYAKSMAEELHPDSLVVTSNVMLDDRRRDEDDDGRVRFEPFVGVGPRRYLEMFSAPPRKLQTGELVEWSGASAEPRLADLEPVELRGERLPYLLRERHAQDLLADIVEQREPKLSVDLPPRGSVEVVEETVAQ
jgi:tRNA(Arg) A34 adenosine deaminase TadA